MSSINDLSTLKRNYRLSDIIGQTLKINKVKQDEFLALCPFHHEKTPSFRIYDETGRYMCYGCGEKGDVFDWLEKKRGMSLADAKAFLENKTQPIESTREVKEVITAVPTPFDNHQFSDGRHSTIYYYRNIEGEIYAKVARYEAGVVGTKKEFRPATHTINGWVNKAPTHNRPPYGLESLVYPGIGFIFEGEKCVDIARKMFPSRAIIGWMGGSSAISKTDFTMLQDGRKWVYWRDNDEGGLKSQDELAKIIPNLYVIPIPDDKEKGWDVADAITEDNWSYDDVVQLINKKVLYDDLNRHSVDSIELSTDVDKSVDKILPRHLLNAPGLVGKISRWMNETALYSLPELELAASITVAGILLAHKVKTRTNLRTNMYVMGISPSGSGKDHPRKCVRSLLEACDLEPVIGGKGKSGAAILSMAARNNGRCLWIPDEFGRVLAAISGKYAQGYQREIATNMMELFSSASTKFIGDELANRDNKTPRIDIEQPCFNTYAVTTKDNLYGAMSSKEAIDGFLSRWIIFEANNPYGDDDVEVDIYDRDYNIEPPVELVEFIKAIQNEPSYDQKTLKPSPKLIPFTEAAHKLIRDFQSSIRKKMKHESVTSLVGETVFNAVWARAAEHANKLALCGYEDDVISEPVMKWAISVAEFCAEKLLAEIENNIADNEHEANVKRVMGIIRKHKGITKSELIHKTRWVRDTRHREDIIKTLLDSQIIEIIVDQKDTKKSRERFYLLKR